MDRVSFVEAIAALPTRLESDGLIRALVRCLAPEEAAELLRRSAATHSIVRSAAIKKVGDDIASSKLADPNSLTSDLMERIRNGRSKQRESVAYSLLNVGRACPQPLKLQIQAFLSDSRYVGLRRRSYKLFVAESRESCQLLEAAWRRHNDYEASLLIVKTFPVPFLVAERTALLENLSEGWQLSRLYLRIADAAPSALQELLELDPISFMYVAAKRAVAPPIATVNQILDLSLGDQRLGLLLWSIGELGLWEVLSTLPDRLDEIESARFTSIQYAAVGQTDGLPPSSSFSAPR